jgi:hypothetical protein
VAKGTQTALLYLWLEEISWKINSVKHSHNLLHINNDDFLLVISFGQMG